MSVENLRAIMGTWLDCMHRGVRLDRDRGEKECMSFDGARVSLDGSRGVVPNIPVRGFNLAYAVREFLWYCGGNRYDHSIVDHAKIWQKFIQPDGGINSNYGQYMFNEYHTLGAPQRSQFEHCYKELLSNPDTRRASMVLLRQEHLYRENADMVCTFGLTFHIRENRLNMHVSMRSNDAVWGLTNDAFCFNMIQRMMVARLKIDYPGLMVGLYTHDAHSMHVYKRHYQMVFEGISQEHLYEEVNPPMPDYDDYLHLIQHPQSDLAGGVFSDWARSVLQ